MRQKRRDLIKSTDTVCKISGNKEFAFHDEIDHDQSLYSHCDVIRLRSITITKIFCNKVAKSTRKTNTTLILCVQYS